MIRDTARRRRIAAALATILLAPLWVPLLGLNALRRRSRAAVARILVIEPWGIGDVVLASGALRSLRAAYPTSRITVLAKAHASTLVISPDMADEVVSCDFPWTAFHGKYRPSRYRVVELWRLFRHLRRSRYDIVLNARSDVRNNVVGALISGRRFISAACGAGNVLATEAVALGRNDHRVDDWARIVRRAIGAEPARIDPTLTVDSAARIRLRTELGLTGETAPIVGIHAGAQNSVRRWELERFASVADILADTIGARIVVFAEPDGYGDDLPTTAPYVVVRRRLDELIAALSLCDVLVCNDSGPMHIASALGVPVTAIFGPMRVEWFGPRGGKSRIIQLDEVPCRPCFDACRYSEPFCMTRIQAGAVVEGTLALLERGSGGAVSSGRKASFPALAPMPLVRR